VEINYTLETNLRVALMLPPIQSFHIPYSAPSIIASWIQKKYKAKTLVIDCGIEWLWSEIRNNFAENSKNFKSIKDLQRIETYRNLKTLRHVYEHAEETLKIICEAWSPERVKIDGKYIAPKKYSDWNDVAEALEKNLAGLFDRYIDFYLIPKLKNFRPQIIGLSIPYIWMLFPAMRLIKKLRDVSKDTTIVIGGHVVRRLWLEKQVKFFKIVGAHWAALKFGEYALDALIAYLKGKNPNFEKVSLVKLPVNNCNDIYLSPKERPPYLSGGIIADFSDLDLNLYLRVSPLIPIPVSEGCFYGKCKFCTRNVVQNIHYYEKSPQEIAKQMKNIANKTKTKEFILAGDNISTHFLLGLAKCLSLNKNCFKWYCETSFKSQFAGILSLKDCQLLHKGGCRVILNGLESGSERIRSLMNCPVNIKKYDKTIHNLVTAGIIPFVTLIVGYPGETYNDLKQTINYVKRNLNIAVFSFSHFCLEVGTPIEKEFENRFNFNELNHNIPSCKINFKEKKSLIKKKIDDQLIKELGGLFGNFQSFLRSIPTIMQLVSFSEDNSNGKIKV
jgi:radical SAM superfamily enzyme YgiQ (UPF0313 family)